MDMIEGPEYKRYAEQLGFEHYIPKYKVIPGSRENWSSRDSPTLRGTRPQGAIFSEEDFHTLVKVLTLPLLVLAGAVLYPLIVLKEQPARIASSTKSA